MTQFARTLGGKAEASVFGSNYKTSAVNAALVNGTLGHGDEIDESLEEAGHASAVIIPAAMACGEKEKASGKDMITAVVAGYDMAGHLVNAGVLPRLMFVNRFVMSFWATATAVNILKIGTNKARIAFGLAAVQAGGIYDVGGEAKHMAKSLGYSSGTRNGVTAALLAQMGYDGPLYIFDGPENVLTAAVGQNYVEQELVKNLGKKFNIMDTCIKLYSAGHPIHAPIDGLRKIMEREKISAEQIKSITVRQPEFEHNTVDDRDMPEINVQYCMAVFAFDRRLTWDQYKPERVKDAKVLDLKSRIKAIHDPRLDERKKITKAHSAEVELETRNGRKFVEMVDYPPGDPGNPARPEDVEQKALYYASKVLGQRRAKNLIKTINNLETVADLNQVGNLLRIHETR
jgi:2-methylcitrate dehydratase PrpD